ncbi:MAG: hypothetical protein NT167_18245 [Verrucomicrobia bacterium]|nr:hypothetical protein [Verrucomicrobiota bacterium]
MVDLARGIAAAADFHGDLLGRDESGRVALFGAAVAERDVARGLGGEFKLRRDGQVKRVWQPGKDIEPLAERTERPRCRSHGTNATEQDDAQLARACCGAKRLAGRQLTVLERDELETKIVYTIGKSLGRNQQVVHRYGRVF